MFIPLEKIHFDKPFDANTPRLDDPSSDMSVARLCQEAFEEGRAAGIKEAQSMKSQGEKTQTRQLLEKIRKELGARNAFRMKYEAQAAKTYIGLLKDTLTRLFPTFEDRWQTLETTVFLKNFLNAFSEEPHAVRIMVPRKLLSELEKYFEKSEGLLGSSVTWVTAGNQEESGVQVCWEDGGVNYARTQLFLEILHVLEKYASSEKSEQVIINGEKK